MITRRSFLAPCEPLSPTDIQSRLDFQAGSSNPALAISAEDAAAKCAVFFGGSQPVLHYTKMAAVFYWVVRVVLRLLPGIYQGTARMSDSETLIRG